MLANRWFRLSIALVCVLIWCGVYLLLRFTKCNSRRWNRVITIVGFVMGVAWMGCVVTDHDHLGTIFQLNWLSALSATLWAQRRQNNTVANFSEMPSMCIGTRLPDGTPIRAACPFCGAEFSTEAFDDDSGYPHQSKLQERYVEHAKVHIRS